VRLPQWWSRFFLSVLALVVVKKVVHSFQIHGGSWLRGKSKRPALSLTDTIHAARFQDVLN
jgi:hypothetical protein